MQKTWGEKNKFLQFTQFGWLGSNRILTVISRHSYCKTKLWHRTCVLYDPMKQPTTPPVTCKESNKSSQTKLHLASLGWAFISWWSNRTTTSCKRSFSTAGLGTNIKAPLEGIGCPTKPPATLVAKRGCDCNLKIKNRYVYVMFEIFQKVRTHQKPKDYCISGVMWVVIFGYFDESLHLLI